MRADRVDRPDWSGPCTCHIRNSHLHAGPKGLATNAATPDRVNPPKRLGRSSHLSNSLFDGPIELDLPNRFSTLSSNLITPPSEPKMYYQGIQFLPSHTTPFWVISYELLAVKECLMLNVSIHWIELTRSGMGFLFQFGLE